MNEKQTEIIEYLKKYDQRSVALGFFVLSAWLPNRSAGPRLLYALSTVLTSEHKDKNQKSVKTWQEFSEFAQGLFGVLGEPSMLEDYIPEDDWGEIRYYYEGAQYKVFYGTELSWTYDFLSAFELIYKNYADQIEALLGRNPIGDMSICLRLQDSLIEHVRNEKESAPIQPGHLEVPPEWFFESCKEFSSVASAIVENVEFEEFYSVKFGEIDPGLLTDPSFVEAMVSGKLDYLFVKCGEFFQIVFPRRITPVLIERWHLLIQPVAAKIKRDSPPPVAIDLGLAVAAHAQSRLRERSRFVLVSIVDKDMKSEDFIFPLAILSRDQIFFFCIVGPFKSITPQLSDLADNIEKTKKIMKDPWFLRRHLEQDGIQFSKRLEELPKAKFIVIVPTTTLSPQGLELPDNLDASVWFLADFLGILDEVTSENEFSDFLQYEDKMKESSNLVALGKIDSFASFKDTDNVMIEGVNVPSMVMVDPHWGSHRRFNTLKEIWKWVPDHFDYGAPTAWEVKPQMDKRVRFISKSALRSILFTKCSNLQVSLTAPFERISREEVFYCDLLVQSLCDHISDFSETLQHHEALVGLRDLHIIIFPDSALSNPEFKHLIHLKPGENRWAMDSGSLRPGTLGVRMVFNVEMIVRKLTDVKDRTVEIDFFQDLISELERVNSTPKVAMEVIKASDAMRSSKPRYTIMVAEKESAFPEFVNPWEPERRHFKLARNRIAEALKNIGVKSGMYEQSQAKKVLNGITLEIDRALREDLKRFDWKKSMPFFLARLGALGAHFHRSELDAKDAKNREVEYDEKTKHAEAQESFNNMHRNYRHLVENLVLDAPTSELVIDPDSFQYLAALADWYFVFAQASDQIHYAITSAELEITDALLANVHFEEGAMDKMRIYGREQASSQLQGGISDEDGLEDDVVTHLDEVDRAFMEDMGFGLRNLVALLRVMAFWPGYAEEEEAEYYSAQPDRVIDVAMKAIKGGSRDEFAKILDFLILKGDELTKVIGRAQPESRLPVWEYYKRHTRLNIRPIIRVDNKVVWSPHLAARSGKVWANCPSVCKTPYNMDAPKVSVVLSSKKKEKEDGLVHKCEEICKSVSAYVEKEVELHKRDRDFVHPPELGDYDVLIYLERSNTVLAIECKHLLPVYSLKDARDLKEELFGKDEELGGYSAKVENRCAYLEKNIERVFDIFKWPKPSSSPRVIPVMLTLHSYWWTRFPPSPTRIEFVQLMNFRKYVKEKSENT